VSRCQNKNCLRFWCKSTNAYADFILWKLVWKWATPILIWKNIILPIHLSQWPFSGPKKTHFQTDPNIISSWWDIYICIYIYPVFIAGFITSIWKKVYPVYQSWSIYAQYPHCICIALHSHIGSHGGEIRGLLVVPHIGCVWHLCLGWGWG
jgi:hypothetical protein